MAVVNAYQDAAILAGKNTNPAFSQGAAVMGAVSTFEVAAADDNDSIYRVFKGVPGDMIVLSLQLACDAIAGMTDVNVGLWETNLGAVVSENCFADAVNPSAGYAFRAELNLLAGLGVEKIQKRIYEVGGHTIITRKPSYDICLKAVAAAAAAGTVSIRALFLQA